MGSPPSELQGLIHDWNKTGAGAGPPAGTVMLDDETLRDGLQSPSVTSPTLDQKKRILHLMEALGIESADVGLPAAGPHVVATVRVLCREIRDHRMKLRPNCAGRTLVSDVEPIARLQHEIGIPIEACLFIGSSVIRQYAESWTLDQMLRLVEQSLAFAAKESVPVMFVTEDTTRARPEQLQQLYATAIACGAKRVCIADTVGHATPDGAEALTRFVVEEVVRPTGLDIGVDWHGHKDRGLDVWNALAAARAGATRIHGCGLGIGERAGNTPMEILLINLHLLGWRKHDLSRLPEYCRAVSEACRTPIPRNYPVVGQDAFETGTGVHAAAVIKAFQKGDAWLADRVYSSVPASVIGLRQRIRVGPMSGRSNVTWWLEEHGWEVTEERIERIFQAAKSSNRMLEDEDLERLAIG